MNLYLLFEAKDGQADCVAMSFFDIKRLIDSYEYFNSLMNIEYNEAEYLDWYVEAFLKSRDKSIDRYNLNKELIHYLDAMIRDSYSSDGLLKD